MATMAAVCASTAPASRKCTSPPSGNSTSPMKEWNCPPTPGLTLFVLTAEPSSVTANRLKLFAGWAATEGHAATAVAHESAGSK